MKTLSFVFTFARKYLSSLVITILSMLLLVGAQLVIPWIIRLLVNAVSTPDLSDSSFDLISTLTLIVLGVYLARAGLQYLRSYKAHIAGWGVVADLRKHVLTICRD